jgi:hypothetical protein
MRHMSFALTERQLLDGSKTVTRRLGWRTVKPGDELLAVRKTMGLRKGESHHALARIRVKSVRREPLCEMLAGDCAREGFPHMRPSDFVRFFCAANKCAPSREITRIEFELLE